MFVKAKQIAQFLPSVLVSPSEKPKGNTSFDNLESEKELDGKKARTIFIN